MLFKKCTYCIWLTNHYYLNKQYGQYRIFLNSNCQFSNQLSYRLVYYIKLFKIRCPTILAIIIILKFKALLSYLVKTKKLWRTFWCFGRNFFPKHFFSGLFWEFINMFLKKWICFQLKNNYFQVKFSCYQPIFRVISGYFGINFINNTYP